MKSSELIDWQSLTTGCYWLCRIPCSKGLNAEFTVYEAGKTRFFVFFKTVTILFVLAMTLIFCWHFQGVYKQQFSAMEERKIKRKSPRPSTNSHSGPPGTARKNASSKNPGLSGMGTHSSQKTKYKRYVTSERAKNSITSLMVWPTEPWDISALQW